GEGDAAHLAATLLAGWMAQQLRWHPEERLSASSLRLSGAMGPEVTLRFEPGPGDRGGHPPLLRRLLVEGEAGAAVDIEHHGRHLAMTVRSAGAVVGHWAGAAGAEVRTESETLCEEFSIHGADRLFQQSL